MDVADIWFIAAKFLDFWLVRRTTTQIDQASCHGWTQRSHSAFWLEGITARSRSRRRRSSSSCWGEKGMWRSRLRWVAVKFVDDLKKACKKDKKQERNQRSLQRHVSTAAGFQSTRRQESRRLETAITQRRTRIWTGEWNQFKPLEVLNHRLLTQNS